MKLPTHLVRASLATLVSFPFISAASGQCFGDRTPLFSSHPSSNQTMGESGVMSGSVSVFGAPYGFPDKGSAYVFAWINDAWTPDGRLQASNTTEYDSFGRQVATDGTRIIVGALSGTENPQGAAYIFRKSGGTWLEEAILQPPDADAYIGFVVAIHGDLAILGDPSRTINGEYGSGMIYTYVRTMSGWVYQNKYNPSTPLQHRSFGTSVAIDGSRVVVGAPGDTAAGALEAGALYVYTRTGNLLASNPTVVSAQIPEADEGLGRRVALDGARIVAASGGGGTTGPVRLFVHSGGMWQEEAAISSPWGADYVDFGHAIDLSGDHLAISAPDYDGAFFSEGAVAIYRREAGLWNPVNILTHPNPGGFYRFGYSLGLDSGRLAIGVPDDDVQEIESGSAFAYWNDSLSATDPMDANATLGETAVFTSVVGGAGPFVHRWEINGEPIPENMPPYAGAGTPTLTIEQAFAPMTDAIRLRVTDACGFIRYTDRASLSVTVPPAPCPGDANGDGQVLFNDITSVLTFFNTTCP